MSKLEYPLAHHPDTGLSKFECGGIPNDFIPILLSKEVDPFNAYNGPQGLDEVNFIAQQWLDNLSIRPIKEDFYPCGLDNFIIIANIIELGFQDQLGNIVESNPSGGIVDIDVIADIQSLLKMFLEDMETIDERIFDLAHDCEMVIMNNTVLHDYHFVKSKDGFYGHFTLKSSSSAFPVSLDFRFIGNPLESSFEYRVIINTH